MNELKYVEELIDSSSIPDKTSVSSVITYLTKYYYELYDSCDSVVDAVCEQMKKYNLKVENYQEYKFKSRMISLFKSLEEGKTDRLKTHESIPLYRSEYEKILSCKADKEKKLLFTLYILARYTGKYGWVYIPRKDIFNLANVSYNKDSKILIRNLLQQVLIKNTKKVDDTKIGVELDDVAEDITMKIYNMENLGNQFMVHLKPDYKLCECCNKIIKIKGANSKYCKICAKKKESESKEIRNRKYYEKHRKIVC